MSPELTERFDLPPGLRLATGAYSAEFGRPPATTWQVPGTVTLLANGPLRLTVASPWGTIAAAGPRDDDVIELVKMEHPGKRERLTVEEAAAGAGPGWAGTGLRAARGGATLLVKSELPEGSGVGAGIAAQTAIRLCLVGARTPDSGEDITAASALAGNRQLPFDLAAAGLRLVIIDTRLRGVPQQAPVERSPVAAAAEALSAGDIMAVGPLMTAAHEAMACDEAQHVAVSTALRAGAIGARMITDGPGRPACALVSASRLADLRAAVSDRFARGKLRPPRFLTFTPACGPQRLWPTCPPHEVTGLRTYPAELLDRDRHGPVNESLGRFVGCEAYGVESLRDVVELRVDVPTRVRVIVRPNEQDARPARGLECDDDPGRPHAGA